MREKELRLALICYGGVSLAVYMHGVTREIWHLLRASRAFHDGTPPGPGSEAIYRDILADMEAKSGVKLRVLADIIAGSSAGGINGIFLAQAIVTGQSLEPLTDMWLETADVDTLLDPDARPLSRFTKFWATPIAWMILRRRGGMIDATVSKDAREEVAHKLSRFVRARWFAPHSGGGFFLNCCLMRWGQCRLVFQVRSCCPIISRSICLSQLPIFMATTRCCGSTARLWLRRPSTG